jgi:hypothetical protein
MPTESIRIFASTCASSREYLADPDRWERYAEEDLMRQLSFLIQRERAETIQTEDRYEKRVDLYVATPDVFWKIINEEAEKIAMRYMRR